MSSWEPNRDGLLQITSLLRQCESTDSQTQRNIHGQLQHFNLHVVDFNNYLVYVVCHAKEESESIRAVAGLILKNNIRSGFEKMAPQVKDYVRTNILGVFECDSPLLRQTAGTIVTTIVGSMGLNSWPGLLSTLTHCLDSPDVRVVDGALNALHKICEDCSFEIQADPGRPLAYMIPKLISLFVHSNSVFRRMSLFCVKQFILTMPVALVENMENYLKGLFARGYDEDRETRKIVVHSLVLLFEARSEVLLPHMKGVTNYLMDMSAERNDEDVAMEAVEFFIAVCEQQRAREILLPVLGRLVQILVADMQYSPANQAQLAAEVTRHDTSQPDLPEDIKPRFAKTRVHGGNGNGGRGGGEEDGFQRRDSDGMTDDDDDDDEQVSSWNLRKISASALDALSQKLGTEILPHLLPMISENFKPDKPWPVREGAILAAGAVAKGAEIGIRPYLSQLVPFLLVQLRDPQPCVRSIATWCVSRFSRWIVEQQDHAKFFGPVLLGLLESVYDNNKKVQEAGCSAFATFEEEALGELSPYLGPVLRTLGNAFQKYQASNVFLLYDAISTLADCVGHELAKPQWVQLLMPPLIQKWNELGDDDGGLPPLLECLQSVCEALGKAFNEFTPPVFLRCVNLVQRELVKKRDGGLGGDYNDDFIICSLDLISALCESLEDGIAPHIADSQLPQLINTCAADDDEGVRQSAFALVGDLARFSDNSLRPFLGSLVPILIGSLDPSMSALCNNASWALGEMSLKFCPEMKSFVRPMLDKLIPIQNKLSLNRMMLENSALTLGRLALVCPNELAERLSEVVHSWCLCLRCIRDDYAKGTAFRGLVQVVSLNPQAVVPHTTFLVDSILSWRTPPAELRPLFFSLLSSFKESLGDRVWETHLTRLPPQTRQKLVAVYNL